MQTIELTIYSFNELSEEAKDNARQWFLEGYEPVWTGESFDSIKTFAQHFGVKIVDYCVDQWSYDYRTNHSNKNFRGLTLDVFDRDYMPTGYCLDCDLWMTFYDTFKQTGSAKKAFESAIDAGFKAWRDDIAYQYSKENIDETISINDYQFYENGRI
jgi:hypothetical protein